MPKHAYIDSSVWIGRIEGIPTYRQIIDLHWNQFIQEDWRFFISEAVMLEVLCRPNWDENEKSVEVYKESFDQTYILPIFDNLFQEAISITQKERLKALDAIHIAYSTHYQCDCLITTDSHFKSVSTIPIEFIDLSIAK